MTDHAKLLSNFVDKHLVPYECTNMSLVAIEASMWLFRREFYCMTMTDKLHYYMKEILK